MPTLNLAAGFRRFCIVSLLHEACREIEDNKARIRHTRNRRPSRNRHAPTHHLKRAELPRKPNSPKDHPRSEAPERQPQPQPQQSEPAASRKRAILSPQALLGPYPASTQVAPFRPRPSSDATMIKQRLATDFQGWYRSPASPFTTLFLTEPRAEEDNMLQGVELSDGMDVILYEPDTDSTGRPDDLEVDAVIRYDERIHRWVAEFSWDELRPASERRRGETGDAGQQGFSF